MIVSYIFKELKDLTNVQKMCNIFPKFTHLIKKVKSNIKTCKFSFHLQIW